MAPTRRIDDSGPSAWNRSSRAVSADIPGNPDQRSAGSALTGRPRTAGYGLGVLALLLVGVSVGLDNFGASTALGISGVDRNLRIRVAVIFGVFEGVMPVIGLLIGQSLAHSLGSAADPVAGTLLGLVGAYSIVMELTSGKPVSRDTHDAAPDTRRLVLLAGILSIDNLVIGFALGTYHVNIAVAAVTIAGISVALSLLGLEIGGRLGERLGPRSGLVGGAVLVVVGIAVGTGHL